MGGERECINFKDAVLRRYSLCHSPRSYAKSTETTYRKLARPRRGKSAQPLAPRPRGRRWSALANASSTMAASAMTAANTKCCATCVVREGAVNEVSSCIKSRSPSPERSLMMEHMPSPQWPCRSMTAPRNCASIRSQIGWYLRTLAASRALAA